ncbi:MAG: TraR/DksA C4-type zinc finger protein [Saprospiraceae bacterium]|nr:TraR/DksA C4-type zinc finger protein [Saprospiraceae bacterium]
MSNQTQQYTPAKLIKFKDLIEGNLQETTEELNSLLTNQKDQKEYIAGAQVDFNQNSKHFQQQAKNQQLIRRLEDKLKELEAALKRIEDGTYGVCERTGKLIREERLMVMPTARFDILPIT